MLSDRSIRRALEEGKITITPFRFGCLGSNSYDVHLGDRFLTYSDRYRDVPLDAKKDHEIDECLIPEEGYVLRPGRLYLAVTEEHTKCSRQIVPFLEGKSSLGRLGIRIHATAGKGDAGFVGHWTLEIDVVQPVRVYAGMPIGQLIFWRTEGLVDKPYDQKNTAKYNNHRAVPMRSLMFRNWDEKRQSWLPEEPESPALGPERPA
jgi:dCTP deaminase